MCVCEERERGVESARVQLLSSTLPPHSHSQPFLTLTPESNRAETIPASISVFSQALLRFVPTLFGAWAPPPVRPASEGGDCCSFDSRLCVSTHPSRRISASRSPPLRWSRCCSQCELRHCPEGRPVSLHRLSTRRRTAAARICRCSKSGSVYSHLTATHPSSSAAVGVEST